MYIAWFFLTSWTLSLRVSMNAYFSLLTHPMEPRLVTFCDTTAGIGSVIWDRTTTMTTPIPEGWTDVNAVVILKLQYR